jgi:hypothetical protein
LENRGKNFKKSPAFPATWKEVADSMPAYLLRAEGQGLPQSRSSFRNNGVNGEAASDFNDVRALVF